MTVPGGEAGGLRIDATSVAEYVRLQSCERWLWSRLHRDDTNARLAAYGLRPEPISPMLRARGREHEDAIVRRVKEAGEVELVDLAGQGAEAAVAALRLGATRPVALVQARLEGRLGDVPATGIADLLEVRPGDGGLRIGVMDMKASREDKVEHRIQVAFYAHLIRQLLAAEGLRLAEIHGAILRPDEPPSGFDVAAYEDVLGLLLEPPLGAIHRLSRAPREEAPLHLTYRCDGCSLAALCFRDAAETGDLSLVPFLTLPEKRALAREGIATVDALAALKVPEGSRLAPAPGEEDRVARLGSLWPVGANLDQHVQRARAAARRRGGTAASAPILMEAPAGTMPSRETHPGLVQVFLDAQHDFVADGLYMLAAHVVGPASTLSVVEALTSPLPPSGPDAHREEGNLLVRFTVAVLSALGRAAGAASAPVHFYVYDRHDQRRLLEGMRRHLDRLESIPAFFDLLTETPALTQAMVSFLAAEVKDRLNLGHTSHALPVVASALGFVWDREGRRLDELFRTGVWDGMGVLPDGRACETTARFGSQIPLEYAYAAWGCLPEGSGVLPDRLRQDPPSFADLRELAAARTRAMHHVEERLPGKNRLLEKKPLPVASLPALLPRDRPPSLAALLVEFLFLEHHARLQDLLQLYAMPPERRVATGSSLLLLARDRAAQGTCRFRLDFARAGLDPRAGLAAMNVREGDWAVLGDPATAQPWDVLRGRLCRVARLDGREATLELMDMSFPRSRLRYAHQRDLQVSPGRHYMLDPMADDLVGERLLDACRNGGRNDLLALLEHGAASAPPRTVGPTSATAIADLLELVASAPETPPFTERQREIVGGHLGERLLLVQGPPGTGKTHTVAWAILARLWVAATAGRRMRVLVTAATHTAVDVLVQAVASLRAATTSALGAAGRAPDPLARLTIWKESTDPGAVAAAGVRLLGRGEAPRALAEPLAVIGAVPGGVHRMLKDAGNGHVAWEKKLWDLLVIDEASQVSLPACVMAGASLKREGQALVVGDHRQMPPILAHDWQEEQRRGVQEARIHASTFEYLRDKGFPLVALDRSFRLHRHHAAFLEQHIYRQDGVPLHSRRDESLPPLPPGSAHPLAVAALHPAHPVVLVQHDEIGSLKHNPLEVRLVGYLVAALTGPLGLGGEDGIGIVVPFRAQRTALQSAHPDLARAGAVDTVERFQGGERDVIVVSATASDPDYVLAEAEFLLDPNRFNVAISRPRKKLVLVASTTLFHLTPADVPLFEAALLWKRLRAQFGATVLWDGTVDGARVRVLGGRSSPPAGGRG